MVKIGFEDFKSSILGKVVDQAYYSDSEIALVLKDENGTLSTATMSAYGDCCSYSYIPDIADFDLLVGSTILDYKEINGGSVEDGCIKWDFYKFKTSNGYVTVELRNESNGYYSGYFGYCIEVKNDDRDKLM